MVPEQERLPGRRRTATGPGGRSDPAAPPPAGAAVADAADGAATANEVRLVGRVSGEPEERALPSGDLLVVWRVVVGRPAVRRAAPPGVRLPTSDTLWCVGWSSTVRRTARGLSPGDVVEVHGALRQRYWRAGAGLTGRTEVEVAAVRRLSRAAG